MSSHVKFFTMKGEIHAPGGEALFSTCWSDDRMDARFCNRPERVKKKELQTTKKGDKGKTTKKQKDSGSPPPAQVCSAPAAPPPATAKKAPSPWKGTNAALGYIINTGNTDTSDLNLDLNVVYTAKHWGTTLEGSGYRGKSTGTDKKTQLTKEHFSVTNQWDYYFNESHDNFAFFNGNYIYDHFAPYEFQSKLVVGYGQKLIKTNRFTLTAQAGPGVRYNGIRNPHGRDTVENNFIISTGATAAWTIYHDIMFTQKVDFDYGKPFNYLR